MNGREARTIGSNFAEWEVSLDATPPAQWRLSAWAEDEAGNVEQMPHELVITLGPLGWRQFGVRDFPF